MYFPILTYLQALVMCRCEKNNKACTSGKFLLVRVEDTRSKVERKEVEILCYEGSAKIAIFLQFKESDFYRLGGARNVTIDFKYDVLCW